MEREDRNSDFTRGGQAGPGRSVGPGGALAVNEHSADVKHSCPLSTQDISQSEYSASKLA